MEKEHIGDVIKRLRTEQNITQDELAKRLGTTQSAVARMESGTQNLSLDTLTKLSEALKRPLVSTKETIDFHVEGGRKLHGSIDTNTSKNGAICMMVASLLNKGKTTLHGIPHIEEVYRYKEVLESIGANVTWSSNNSLTITPPDEYTLEKINRKVASAIRSFTFAGAFIHLANTSSLPHSGGCKMGERTVASHKFALENLGVNIETKDEDYIITHNGLHAGEITLYESSDTGAITALIASAKVKGKTTIYFAPPNYQVQDVCFLLEKFGVKIEGIGSTTLVVHGVSEIDIDVEHYNSEDPIESMFFISAGIVTRSELTIKRCPIEFLRLELEKLKRMGQSMKTSDIYLSKNNKTKLVDITIFPSDLHAPYDKIHTQPFPGLNNDNLPFFVPIACAASGTTMIHDWTWENRAIYFTELNRLGAEIKLLDPHRVLVHGPVSLRGAQIVSPPALRPTAIILIAMLGATGTSTLRNVYSIRRGYADIAERLNSIGANIVVETSIL